MEPKQPKPRRGYRKILAYSLLSIALVYGLFQLYLWNLDRQEWAAIEALLAEQDQIRPGWRWSEYQPEASKPGDKNGAIRFIEVGKQITEKMLETPDVPSEEYVDYPQGSKQGLTTLERDSILLDLKITRDQCHHLEAHLPQLMNYMPGSPLWLARKPPAYLYLGLGRVDEKYVDPDLEAFHRCESWLYRLQNYHRQANKGDQAGRAWLAALMLCFNSSPGIINTPKLRGQTVCFRLLYELLSQTEMSDPVLLQLQQSMPLWRQQLWTADDNNFERTFHIQLLKEMQAGIDSLSMENLRLLYVDPPSWLPEKIRQFLKHQGVGAPRLSSLYRMEYQTHLRWFDVMAEMQRTNSVRIPVDVEDQKLFPGLHWHIHFQPRWRKWLSDRIDMRNKLFAMEAILAAERYRVKHHQMPSQWSQLVPQYLQEIPSSEGKPFILKTVSDGVVVFVDAEKNQGGKVLRTYDPNQTGYEEIDVGVILFHPHLRRQPPPPRAVLKQEENQ